jgi:hypothetical protein
MKFIAIALIALSLAGCGKFDQLEAHYTGWSEICVKGVQYIQFTSGSSVEYDQAGQVVKCGK